MKHFGGFIMLNVLLFSYFSKKCLNFTRSNVISPSFSGKELRPEISICVCTHKHIHTIHVFGKTTLENMSILLQDVERVTGRKTRGLQRGEIGCKCQTFFSLLSSRRKQASNIFFPSLYKFKRRFFLKYCVVIMTPGVRLSR